MHIITPDVQQVVHSRWGYLQRGRYYRQYAATDLLSAWRCWHNFARFRALRRAANKASRLARRQRVDHLLMEAEASAQSTKCTLSSDNSHPSSRTEK